MSQSTTQQLIKRYQRRLALLEQQRAQEGLNVNPSIVMEIEDIYTELNRLMIRDVVVKEEQPRRFPGLMLLVGPGRVGQPPLDQSAVDAINFHRSTLRHCWLIGSSGPNGSRLVVEDVQRQYQHSEVTMYAYYVHNPMSVQESYELIDRLYREVVPHTGLQEEDVIADITGATKPMSFGMLLACGTRRPMQYMVRQPHGPSVPILLRYTIGESAAS